VNAGSVGMPLGNLVPFGSYSDPTFSFGIRPTIRECAERIRETKYPQAQDFAAHNVLQPPSEREPLEAFTRVELT
jgi:hypothetical protein